MLFRRSCILFGLAALLSLSPSASAKKQGPKPVHFSEFELTGELQQRIERNFNRLQEQKYQPDYVFLTEAQSGGWPGDTEGRTILGLVLEAQAGHLQPRYLDEIVRRIPAHLNERGYMGPVYVNMLNEQQLSGNGWMLRGLCELYTWTKDEQVLSLIRSIAHNLFVPGKPYYKDYPIQPASRPEDVGEASGNIEETSGHWMLSTDVGCVFIGMEGLIHAYDLLRTEEVRDIVEELIQLFLKIDLAGIKAQTHASLTACRGLVRYAEITNDARLIEEAEKRFQLYLKEGMTENYSNYNWFDRFNTWTEPCAIVDSYMLVMQLWQHTGKPEYLELAELIYQNSLRHAQRWNGGFGLENCPGLATNTPFLRVNAPEAHWCCTMRGGEGLARVAQYSCFEQDKNVYLPTFRNAEYQLQLAHKKRFSFAVETDYPYEGKVKIRIRENQAGKVTLHLYVPSWATGARLLVDGEATAVASSRFATLSRKFRAGDVVELQFEQKLEFHPTLNPRNTRPGTLRAFYGPLLLGAERAEAAVLPANAPLERTDRDHFRVAGTDVELTPVAHFMRRDVWSDTPYQKQILF